MINGIDDLEKNDDDSLVGLAGLTAFQSIASSKIDVVLPWRRLVMSKKIGLTSKSLGCCRPCVKSNDTLQKLGCGNVRSA